jgi:hypothetical protein
LAEAPAVPPPPAPPLNIEPQNALEQTFVDALTDETARPLFRRQFLTARVALAVVSIEPLSPPRQVELQPGVRTCLVFTSPARAAQVMGSEAPVILVTGRQALQRIRGANVVININLSPSLVLEPDDIEAYLEMPDESAPRAAAPEPQSPRLAGPSQ